MSELVVNEQLIEISCQIAKRGNAGPNIACALAYEIDRLNELVLSLRTVLRGVQELADNVDMKYCKGDWNESEWDHCNPSGCFIPNDMLHKALANYHDGGW